MNIDLEPYRALAEAGVLAVAEETGRHDLNALGIINLLREVCSMNIGAVKGTLFRVWPEMHAFHSQLLAELDATHAHMERENDAS